MSTNNHRKESAPNTEQLQTSVNEGPLTGYRVMEIGSLIMVPYAAQLLGDLGCQVIKVESPDGDGNRFMGDGPHLGLSGVALNIHRNKKSIAVDLKRPGATRVVKRLLKDCDALVTNLMPDSLHNLGLSYDDLKDEFPNLVYCEAHGFRTGSEDFDLPALDDTIQAWTGLPSLQTKLGLEPRFLPILLADKVAGMTAAYAVMAALLARARTGLGQRVEVPMFDTVLAFNLTEHLARATFPGGEAGYSRIVTLNRGPHKTKNGWIGMMPYTTKQWRTLYAAVGAENLLDQPWHADMAARIQNADRVYGELKEVVLQKTTEEWLELCLKLKVPAAPIVHLSEIVEDPSLHRGVISESEHPIAGPYRDVRSPVIFESTPVNWLRSPAPLIGGNGRELLESVAFSSDEITRLASDGVVVLEDDGG